MVSRLKYFSFDSVDQLLEHGVDMCYDRTLRKRDHLGEFRPCDNQILICPTQQEKNRILRQQEMDNTIVHEWLHAYEFNVLERDFRECDVEKWSKYHVIVQPQLVDYIRSFFTEEGF